LEIVEYISQADYFMFMSQGEYLISRKKIKMRNIVFLSILSICITEMIFLPIIVDSQMNSGDIEFTTETIYDLKVRRAFIYRKGIFAEVSDWHIFKFKMKQDVDYVARMKVTAVDGGRFVIAIRGATTLSFHDEDISSPITNYLFETNFTADATTIGQVDVTYILVSSTQNPTYSLYLNKSGFAGWWWIALSGIGAVAVLIFIFTFMVIGLISTSKRKKKTKKKKKK